MLSPAKTKSQTLGKVVLLFLLFIVILEVSTLWSLLFPLNKTHLKYYRLVSSIIELILICIILRPSKLSRYFRQKTRSFYYALALIFACLVVFLQYPLNILYNHLFGTAFGMPQILTFSSFHPNKIATILLAPLSEELYFKLLIQRRLHLKFSPIMSILAVAFLFGLIHFQYVDLLFDKPINAYSFHHAYITFFGGLFSAILYWKSKSVLPCILMHMVWNALVAL